MPTRAMAGAEFPFMAHKWLIQFGVQNRTVAKSTKSGRLARRGC